MVSESERVIVPLFDVTLDLVTGLGDSWLADCVLGTLMP